MPQTRRQYQEWVRTRGDNYQSTQEESECEECSQRSSQLSHGVASFDFDDMPGPSRSMYRDSDRCKRHRLRDSEPYSTVVSAYRRRKPQ